MDAARELRVIPSLVNQRTEIFLPLAPLALPVVSVSLSSGHSQMILVSAFNNLPLPFGT